MDTGLTGKVAIVTGGSQGIGKGICTRLADEGVIVVVADVEPTAGQRVVDEMRNQGRQGRYVHCDVTKRAQTEQLTKMVINEFGTVDILVNNAGVSLVRPFRDMGEAEWDRVMDVNLKGTFLCCSSVIGTMVANGRGNIVNLSSVAGKFPMALQEAYCASKAGIIAFTQSLAYEYGRHNININAVCPGVVRTPMWEKVLDEMAATGGLNKDEIFQQYVGPIPLGRAQTPETIGGVVVFLCSDIAKDITGQAVSVTGGQDAMFFEE